MRTFVLAALLSSAALAKSEDHSVPSFNSVHVSAGMRAPENYWIGPWRWQRRAEIWKALAGQS